MPASYPYFFANLPVFAVVASILILGRRRPLCRFALYGGLACLPCTLLAPIHEGYWRPARLWGGPIGVEDLIFTFTAGASVWLGAAWPYRRGLGLQLPVPTGRVVKRIVVWGALSDALLAALWLAGLDAMSATLLSGVPLLAFLLVRRRQLWILAATGLPYFVPIYLAVVKLQFAVFPDYPSAWNKQGPWAFPFLGVPAGELAWASAFAILWPVMIASAFDVECRVGSQHSSRLVSAA